jgi:hypothetical protein
LQKRDVTVEIARTRLFLIIDKINKKRDILGWHNPPEQFEGEYIKLQILCSHIISKSLETNNPDNLRAFILDFCQFGDHCNAKIKEIVHQNYLCAFNLIGTTTVKKLSDCESIDDIVSYAFRQAFEKTIRNIADLVIFSAARDQSIHVETCVRRLLKSELDILSPYDPNQVLDATALDRDDFGWTGKDEFKEGCVKELFPHFFSHSLIDELHGVQLELLRERNFDLLGKLNQAVYNQVESQFSKTDPKFVKLVQDHVLQRQKLKEEKEANEQPLLHLSALASIICFKEHEGNLKELDTVLQSTASEITSLMEEKKFLKKREEKTATSILPTIFSGNTHKRKVTVEGYAKTLLEETEEEIVALETKRSGIRTQIETAQGVAAQLLEVSPEIRDYLQRLEKAKVLELKYQQFGENRFEIQQYLQNEVEKMGLFYESGGVDLVSYKGFVKILQLARLLTI